MFEMSTKEKLYCEQQIDKQAAYLESLPLVPYTLTEIDGIRRRADESIRFDIDKTLTPMQACARISWIEDNLEYRIRRGKRDIPTPPATGNRIVGQMEF